MHTEPTADQQKSLELLAIPFDPAAISWRVTNKSKDGKLGCVIPYGDQRAYTDRLNSVLSPAGWTRTYDVTTISPVMRSKKNTTIQSGKVIVICVVTRYTVSARIAASGEMWADDDNATTRAEAQAFKRACSCFGLGRYFYDFAATWVDLNEYGQPVRLPSLPKWALPPGVVPTHQGADHHNQSRSGEPVRNSSAPSSASKGPVAVQGTGSQSAASLDPALTQQIEGFRQVVGDALFFEVFRRGGAARNARDLPSVEAQKWILNQLSVIDRGIKRLRVLAEEVHENVFYAALDEHKVQSIDKIPSFEVLKAVVTDLQHAAQGVAA